MTFIIFLLDSSNSNSKRDMHDDKVSKGEDIFMLYSTVHGYFINFHL